MSLRLERANLLFLTGSHATIEYAMAVKSWGVE